MNVPRLRPVREQRGMTRRQLAQRARLHHRTIVRLELGDSARHLTVQRLADALGVTPADLLYTAGAMQGRRRPDCSSFTGAVPADDGPLARRGDFVLVHAHERVTGPREWQPGDLRRERSQAT